MIESSGNPGLREDERIKIELGERIPASVGRGNQYREVRTPDHHVTERILGKLNLFDFSGHETPPEGICEHELLAHTPRLAAGLFF